MPRKKKDKNQNALKHGAYSRKAMLPGEKYCDYVALREAHYDEWAPEGITEQCSVDDLCKLRWKKQRMDQYDQIRLQQEHAKFRKQNDANFHRFILKGLASKFNEAASVEAVEHELSLYPNYAQVITEKVPREKCQDPTQWGREIGKALSKLEVEDQMDDPDLFFAIINPYVFGLEISRSDRLDEAIDRKIKQLLQIKTAKQVFPNMRKNARPEPKLINPPARALSQPAVISQNEPESATQTEIAVSAYSNAEKETFTNQSPVVIEGVRIDEAGPAATSGITEKGYSELTLAKVEFVAKQVPPTVDELQAFSALCKQVMSSSARSNPASSPTST